MAAFGMKYGGNWKATIPSLPASRSGAIAAPEHLERHIDDFLRRSRKLVIALILRRHHLTQLLWEPRDLSSMLSHQRERFDIEDEPLGCALGPPSLALRSAGRGIVGRIDFDRVELLGVKAQPLFSASHGRRIK
ncbi:MAG: hypothetical protein WA410_07730 [Candidatus Binatus sp.]